MNAVVTGDIVKQPRYLKQTRTLASCAVLNISLEYQQRSVLMATEVRQ